MLSGVIIMAGFDLTFMLYCTKCDYSFNPYAISDIIDTMENIFNYWQQNYKCPKCGAVHSWGHNAA